MNENKKYYQEYSKIIDLFDKANLTKDITLTFIADNNELITKIEDFSSHLFFIMNGEQVYGIVIIVEDHYYWSTFSNNEFTKFQEYTDDDKEFLSICNYIVEMVLGYPDQKDVRELLPDIDMENLNLEQKIKKLCNINYNQERYHIK